MAKIKIKKISVKKISSEQQKEMFSLFSKYYDSVIFDKFVSDLKNKTAAMLLYDMSVGDGKLIGFSTILREHCKSTISYTALFSGDTVIEKEYWGRKDLQKAFFSYIVQTKIIFFWRPVYWFLISKGYKTYMMMVNNFRYTYPCQSHDTPSIEQGVLDSFYTKMFSTAYDKDHGLVIAEKNSDYVKGNYQDISEKDLKNLDIQYFFKRNPNFDKGVELACITKITWGDFIFHIPKFFISAVFNRKSTSRRSR